MGDTPFWEGFWRGAFYGAVIGAVIVVLFFWGLA